MASIKVRYVGGAPAKIYDTPYEFTAYGQLVQMPEELYKSCRDRVPLLTEDEFAQIKHDPQHLKTFARFDTHSRAPEEFKEAVRRGWGIHQGADKQPAALPIAVRELEESDANN